MSNVNKYGEWWKDTIAQNIIQKKYMHDDELKVVKEQGFEKGFDMFVKRVSSIFSKKELREKIEKYLREGTFLPAGRTLYAAGCKGKFKASCSNCYIMPSPEDNIESILETAKEMARIFSYGGGAGINISNLRPKGAAVNNSAKTSSGAVSFMDIYNVIGEVIGNNGRRSAILIALNCTHPDIEEFLKIKQNNTKIQGANISIAFTDSFMRAVEDEDTFTLKYKCQDGETITKEINAREFFLKFCEAQYDWGEPGALFIDEVRDWNLLSGFEDYKIDVTNPCAEFAGSAYNSCNLGSINLYNVVEEPFTKNAHVDTFKLSKITRDAVELLDEILDYGYDLQPLDANRKCIDDWRSIGLGVFGLADMLVALGIKYGSDESLVVIESVMNTIRDAAFIKSAELGKLKGSFGKFDRNKFEDSAFVKTVLDSFTPQVQADVCGAMRNGTLLSIAPTGSISMLMRESGGVEPYYQVAYDRTTHILEKEGKSFHIGMLAVEHLLKHNNDPLTMSNEDIKKKYPFVVDTYDIDPLSRIDMQSYMQDYVDNAISSTINLKEDATVEDIFKLYMYAWGAHCKGITIFRDNCKRINILGTDHGVKREDVEEKPKVEKEWVELDKVSKLNSLNPHKRADTKVLSGKTFVYHTSCVPKLYVTVNVKDGDIFEVFVAADKGCQANIATITRLTSYALRLGGKVDDIIKELESALCPACAKLREKDKTISKSCASCIAQALKEMQSYLKGIKENEGYVREAAEIVKEIIEKESSKEVHEGKMKCPECGAYTLIPDGKCAYCNNCGYSKC